MLPLQDQFGILHLPASPVLRTTGLWTDVTVNRILVIVALVLALALIRDYLRLWPMLAGCLVRARGNVEIEHSVSQARIRNRCATVGALILALLMDRYDLCRASFMQAIPPEWRTIAIIGVLICFQLLRLFVYVLIGSIFRTKLDSESRSAAHRCLCNYFLCFLPVFLLSAGILQTPVSVTQWVLWVELALCATVTLLREGQILKSRYSLLQTFLYLCALEMLPFSAIIVSAAML